MSTNQKKQYVKTLTLKDEAMLRAFRNCGCLSMEHLKNYLAMSDGRVLNFVRDGYVKKGWYLDSKKKQMVPVYQLTNRGRKLAEARFEMTHFFRGGGTRHNLAVADKYFSLSLTERDTWKTSMELRRDYQELQDSLPVEDHQTVNTPTVDGAYVTDDGQPTAFEVVTSNHNCSDIQAKKNFSIALGMQFESVKV